MKSQLTAWSVIITANGSGLVEGGEYEAQNSLPAPHPESLRDTNA